MGAVTAADLRNWQLFSYLGASDLTRLAGIAEQRRYRKGETIFSEGDDAGYFLVLLKGQVKIFKLAPDGREQILRVVRAGESFGEAAALSGVSFPAGAEAMAPSLAARFPAGAEAMAPSLAARFPAAAFREVLAESPQLALNLIVAMSELLRGFAALVDAVSLRDVSARLAKYLLDQSARSGEDTFRLELRKRALASRLGTVPETLSRSLRRLRERHVIAESGDRIRILDRRALSRVAAGLKE